MNKFLGILINVLSRSPLWLLYLLSDFFYILGYKVFGYRKDVIRTNLLNSFPEKSLKEIQKIESKFYRNLIDYLVETFKSLSISEKELDHRHTYENLAVFKQIQKEGKGTFILCGHVFNWEWYIGLVKHLVTDNTYAIYHRVHNKLWNKKVNDARARFGTIPLEMGDTTRTILSDKTPQQSTYLFVADQSPYVTNIRYELDFLNQKTPVFLGYDKLIRKKNYAAVYAETKRIKRGHYVTKFIRLEPKNEKFEEHELVHAFFDKLEKTIKTQPSNWLWSHRRWKYSSENKK